MATTYEIELLGEAAAPPPTILANGVPLADGVRVAVDLHMAVYLLDRGLASHPGQVEITPLLKAARAPGVVAAGKVCFPGDRVAVDWSTARGLVGRGRARLADGVVLPTRNPDAKK